MRKLVLIGLVLFSLSLCSCSQYIVKSERPTVEGKDGLEFRSINKQIYFWGVVKSRAPVVDDQCIDDGPLSEVRVKKNFGQGLLSIISFGIVNLSTIEYSCAEF